MARVSDEIGDRWARDEDGTLVMPLGDHLEDLRRRVILALLVPLPVFVACLLAGRPLMTFLTKPVVKALYDAGQPPRMLATGPLETFGAYLKVATIVALVVSLPWVIYQLWLFVAPGLHKAEKRFVYLLMPMSAALTGLSVAFLYSVMLPVSLFFLISFGSFLVQQDVRVAPLPEGIVLQTIPLLDHDVEGAAPGEMWFNGRTNELRLQLPGGEVIGFPGRQGGVIAQEYRIGEYVGLVFNLAIVFALAFQLPVVMMLLNWVGILEPRDVTPYRRYVALGCGVAGAVLTPQDPWSMIALGGALYALFELGLVLMRVLPASRVAGVREDDAGDAGGEGGS